MNLVFATEYYPPFAPGGSPWSISLLATELARRGHRVSVVTPNYGAAAREEIGGVTVTRFPYWRRLDAGARLARTADLVSPRFHWALSRAIVAEARRIDADVVHAQDKHALVGAFVAARRLRRPVFLTLRDTGLVCPIATCLLTHARVPADCSAWKLQRDCAPFYLDHYIGGGRMQRARVRANIALLYADAALKNALLRRLDGLVSLSQGLLEIYLAAGRGRRERAHVVYSLAPDGAPPAADRAASLRATLGLDGRPTVLYAGKLSIGKGGPIFLDAAEQVAAVRPDVRFVVAGPDAPPARPDAPPAARTADVRWAGRLPHEDMAALYTVVDVVVLPSVGPEALSRVPLEAGALGRATIGTRVGGIPEQILDGETGLLVDRGDANALAKAMLRLIDDEATRHAMGRAAQRFVAERFDADTVVASLLEVYRSAA